MLLQATLNNCAQGIESVLNRFGLTKEVAALSIPIPVLHA